MSAPTGVSGPTIEQEFSDGTVQVATVGAPAARPALLAAFGLDASAAITTAALMAATVAASILPPPAKVRQKWTAWSGTNVKYLARWWA
jgi:hypothetical protein